MTGERHGVSATWTNHNERAVYVHVALSRDARQNHRDIARLPSGKIDIAKLRDATLPIYEKGELGNVESDLDSTARSKLVGIEDRLNQS
jgi:hypothetical protein